MNIVVPIALFGWIPLVLVLFALLPARRAVIVSFLLAWLFLPVTEYEFVGLPNFTKMTATALAVLLGVVIFDARTLNTFRFAWYDIPILVWIAVPMLSSLDNGLGAYDGLSAMFEHVVTWGVPYFIGRLYLNNLEAMRELAVAVVIGGLIYVPLCLYEIRMSPQLHTIVYGFHQHQFIQTKRFGGWRPTVFMQHGLAVGLWMTTASMVAIWLWQTGTVRQLRNVPMAAIIPVLLVTAVLCKSVGALGLLVGGATAMCAVQVTKSAKIIALLAAMVPGYLTARIVFNWQGGQIVALAEIIEPERAKSVTERITNEDAITERVLQKPLFGWGRWGGYRRVEDHDGRVITDSLWIVTLGRTGLVGLATMVTVVLLPTVLFLHRTRMRNWHHVAWAPPAIMATLIIVFMLDSMFNTMLNPVYIIAAGGLAGLTRGRLKRAPL